MCRTKKLEKGKEDDEKAELIERIQNELTNLTRITDYIQMENERLENEAKQLIEENLRYQIERRLTRDKYFNHRKTLNFQQLKLQLQSQRKNLKKFERRLRLKYEQPLHIIISQYYQKRSKIRR